MSQQPTLPAPGGEPAVDAGAPTRRTVLGLATAAGAAGLLAACGGADPTGADGASTPSGTGSAPDPTGEGGAAGGPLVATSEVPVGAGVILDERKVVVTQPTQGTFKAFSAICTHQSCTVASVKDGTISCACHGSAFSATDGSVTNGPATRPLRAIPVTVEGDQVVES